MSVGNLVSGNRGGGSSTTLLATIVSIDPIYLNFDMSEDDYLNFERDRASHKSALANKVDIALSDENRFVRHGTLNVLDNSLDRASGTIHARATVPNSDLLLTPGEFGRVRLNVQSSHQVLLVLGAERVVDYRTEGFEESLTGMDVVLDTVGGDTQLRSLRVLRPGGILVTVVSPVPDLPQKSTAVRAVFFYAEVTTARLNRITELFDSGKLVTDVGTVLSLEEASVAHEMLADAPHKRGKIVLRMAA